MSCDVCGGETQVMFNELSLTGKLIRVCYNCKEGIMINKPTCPCCGNILYEDNGWFVCSVCKNKFHNLIKYQDNTYSYEQEAVDKRGCT